MGSSSSRCLFDSFRRSSRCDADRWRWLETGSAGRVGRMDTDPLGASERILPAGPAWAGVVAGGAVSETGNRKPARRALGRVDRAGLVHRPPGAAVCHRRAFNKAPRSAFGCTRHTAQSDTSVAVGSFAGRHSPWGNGPGGPDSAARCVGAGDSSRGTEPARVARWSRDSRPTRPSQGCSRSGSWRRFHLGRCIDSHRGRRSASHCMRAGQKPSG
jgi:hypothetical protein